MNELLSLAVSGPLIGRDTLSGGYEIIILDLLMDRVQLSLKVLENSRQVRKGLSHA